MITALKAIKLTDRMTTLETRHNATLKTSEKLMVLLLLPFFGFKDVSHLPQSAVSGWFSVGYNMLYRLLREATFGQSHKNNQLYFRLHPALFFQQKMSINKSRLLQQTTQ